TGRMLEILGPGVSQAMGIDQSREMLAVARVNLEQAGLSNSIVRLGDMYQLPLGDASFDAVVIHQVLHYADRPGAARTEAAGVLRWWGPAAYERWRIARRRRWSTCARNMPTAGSALPMPMSRNGAAPRGWNRRCRDACPATR